MSRKSPYNNKENQRNDPDNNSDTWIWGNHRGGGGAPLKDLHGNNAANLKKVMAGNVELLDHSPNEGLLRNRPYKGSSGMADEHEQYRGGYSPDKTHKSIRIKREDDGYAPQSPRKFMSALKDMNNNYNANDMEAKRRKDLDYQAALKAQIDEKKRLKDEEKRMEDKIKRKELDEFLQNKQNGSSKRDPNRQSNAQDDDDDDRNDRYNYPPKNKSRHEVSSDEERDNSTGRNRRKAKNKMVNFFKKEDDQDNGDGGVTHHGGGKTKNHFNIPGLHHGIAEVTIEDENEGGRHGGEGEEDEGMARGRYQDQKTSFLPPVYKKVHRRNHDDEDVDQDEEVEDRMSLKGKNRSISSLSISSKLKKSKSFGGRVREEDLDDNPPPPRRKGGGSVSGQGSVVSMKEYDALAKLCDQLMEQQAELQQEIRQQANLIQDLQNKVSHRDGHDRNGRNANKGSVQEDPFLRSRSVQQSRPHQENKQPPTKGRGLSVERGGDRGVGPRPSSVQDPVAPKVVAFGSRIEKPSGNAMKKNDGKGMAGGRVLNPDAPFAPKSFPRNGKPPPGMGQQGMMSHGMGEDGDRGKRRSVGKELNKIEGASGVAKKNSRQSSSPNGLRPNYGKPSGGGGGGGGGGFSKLQSNVNNHKSPVVVTYDDEGSSYKSRGNARDNMNEKMGITAKSIELKGKSEYIDINDGVIGGDELDKLLSQARRTRT